MAQLEATRAQAEAAENAKEVAKAALEGKTEEMEQTVKQYTGPLIFRSVRTPFRRTIQGVSDL
jgi:hypothetical protein